MKINHGFSNRGKDYQEEEDAFLVCMMYLHGYGAAEQIQMEIRRAWQFRFDWYFMSRTAVDLHKRCDVLVEIVEREMEDIHKREGMEQSSAANSNQNLVPSMDELARSDIAMLFWGCQSCDISKVKPKIMKTVKWFI